MSSTAWLGVSLDGLSFDEELGKNNLPVRSEGVAASKQKL